MDLVSAADELYGLPLAGFVAGRTRLEKEARAAGERSLAAEIHEMRKPSQAAWAVNQLVRQSPDLLDEVLDLGHELRTAQEARDTSGLRRLTARRHELYDAVRRRAREIVAADGRQLGGDADRALERTLGSAMADARVAEVVRSGRLVVDLENAGWGSVDLDGAQAAPERGPASEGSGSSTARDTGAERDGAERDGAERDGAERLTAQRSLAQAQEAAREAAAVLDRAEEALSAATAERRRLADRKKELLAELREVEVGEERAVEVVRSSREARTAAAREVERSMRLAAGARRRAEGVARRA